MHKIALALFLILGLAGPAFGQACPAVAALPDTERRVVYSPSASTGPFSVTFAILGDSTDAGNWLELWLDDVKLTYATQWTFSLSSGGSVATACRPITNGQVTLVAPATGTLEIVGARRPRRLSQFTEGTGVTARDLNRVITDLVAENRETWDRAARSLTGPPGEVIAVMPNAAGRAGKVLRFDATGLIPEFFAGVGSGTVVGPVTSTIGRIATWADATGTTLASSSPIVGPVFTTPLMTGGTHTGITSLGLRSSGSGAFDLTLRNNENLTAARALTFTTNDNDRIINLAGNLILSSTFNVAGSQSTTLTATGPTNVTMPTTGTLATLTGVETFTNKTLTSPTLTTPVLGVATGTSLALGGCTISTHVLCATGTALFNNPIITTPIANTVTIRTSGATATQTGIFSTSNNQIGFSGNNSNMTSFARTGGFFFDATAAYLEVDVVSVGGPLNFDAFISRSAAGIARFGTAYNNSLGSALALSYRYDATNVITDATTARTLGATDNGRTIIFTSGSAVTVTVPAGLGAAFYVRVIRGGAGSVTFAASGTTVNSAGGLLSIAAQYNSATLYGTAANVFLLDGTLI